MAGDNRYHTGRRSFIKKIGATGTAIGLAGCTGTGGGGSGSNKPNSITFGTWGGTWQDLCIEAAIKPFREETDIKVDYVLGSEDRFNKLIAQKQNPPMHLDQQGLANLQKGAVEGMYQDLNSDILPIYEDVPDKLKGNKWIAHHFTASSLVYNTDTFDEPPEDMSVYLNTDYKGRVALAEPTQRTPNYDLMAFSLYQTNGKSFKDIEAAFEMYEKVVKTMDPKFAGATEQYGKWFSNGEIDIARIWAARSASWQADGTAINYQIPKSGAVMYSAGHGIPANIDDNMVEWAGELAQYFYEPEASKEFASTMFYPTVNPVVEYSEDVQKSVPLMEDIDGLQLPDYQWMGENQADWTERANSIINKYS
jgi:putative spermidine/putrescine transport system substrate-binding protein